MFQLSVIVPVFNEAPTVILTLAKLIKVEVVSQIVIVDDGSTDHSPKMIEHFLKNQVPLVQRTTTLQVTYLRKKNGGKGSAIRAGLKKVTGNYVLIQDADCEYDPADISELVAPVLNKRVQVVFGSRFLGPHLNLLYWHRLANSLLNFLVNILYNTTLSDMETCYKLLPTKLLRKIHLLSNGFEIEPEITCKILRQGIRIYEVPISYVGRDFSEGKKIGWWDGVHAFWTILRLRVD